MLLPDLKLIPKWAGHRSLGALLFDREIHDRETHAAEHKILKELLSGKKITIPRVRILMETILRKWQSNDEPLGGGLKQRLFTWEQSDEPWIQIDSKDQTAALFWSVLGKFCPEERKETNDLLRGLVERSQGLLRLSRGSGSQGVAQALNDFAAESSANPAQRVFLAEMADLFAAGKEDTARIELAVFGTLLLAVTFLFDSDATTASQLDDLKNLFAVEDNHVNPLMSFSHWLERLGQKTGYTRDMLLWDGFVSPNAEAAELVGQEPRSLLRNPRRYRTGDQVPSYFKAKKCLHSLHPQLQPDEVARWNDELEQREFGILFVLLVANSANSIKQVGGFPERPCQAVFDLVMQRVG